MFDLSMSSWESWYPNGMLFSLTTSVSVSWSWEKVTGFGCPQGIYLHFPSSQSSM